MSEYVQHPTQTGTLQRCLECGALVGSVEEHDRWHAVLADMGVPRRALRVPPNPGVPSTNRGRRRLR